ncbi:MAG TPA: FAD-dependent oxidoreductase [Edaphobacter sp.]|nr:FAD-dependent oxidoreductase [Edaphobacter sp.]
MHVGTISRRVDVFIVGAGPAGLACAIAAASQGLQVEVVDGAKPPIDKACGEGLMPDTLAALVQLGIDLNHASIQEELQSTSFPLRGIRFIGSPSDTRRATTTEAVFPEGQGRGVRRTVLHQLLLQRALALGVRLHWETTVKHIESEQVHTSRNTVRARWIVGADGHQSRIRFLAKLDKASAGPQRIGLRQHFAITPWTNFVEVHWADHTQAYVTPVSPNEVCVAFIASKKFTGIQSALALFPSLQSRLASAPVTDKPRGAITVSRRFHHVTSGNIALIGDASGSVDAITGEGLALCFRQALELAQAFKAEDLSLYEQAHARLHRLPRFMSRSLLMMDRSPRVLKKTLNTFQRKPDLFSQLLKVHVGHSQIRLLGSSGMLASLLCFITS